MPVIILVLLAVGGYIWLSRSRELFCIKVHQGKISIVRGRIPTSLLSDFKDALASVQRGTVRATRSPHGARLLYRGDINSSLQQRLRNILSLYPISRLTATPIDKSEVINTATTAHWLMQMFKRR